MSEKEHQRSIKQLVILTCGHCGTNNVVAECRKCGKGYVLTTAHIEGRRRDDAAGSVAHLGAILLTHKCDACKAAYSGKVEVAESQQRTCPVCHKEFLSQHGR